MELMYVGWMYRKGEGEKRAKKEYIRNDSFVKDRDLWMGLDVSVSLFIVCVHVCENDR